MNLYHIGEKIDEARDHGLPMPAFLAPTGSILLLLGGTGIVLWRLPVAACSAVVAFLGLATPTYHDFWNEVGEDRIEERQAFEGNLVMLGAAVLLLQRARRRD